MKIILTYLLISWQVILYAQQTKSPQATAHITFGSGPVCDVQPTEYIGYSNEVHE